MPPPILGCRGVASKVDRLKQHLTELDIRGAQGDIAGKPIINRATGKPFQHLKEVQEAQRGLVKEIERLKKVLGDTNLSVAERAELQRQLSEGSKLLDLSEQYVPRK